MADRVDVTRRDEFELDEYWTVLQNSLLSDDSIRDYYYFAEAYVRWLRGEFVPGERLTHTQMRLESQR